MAITVTTFHPAWSEASEGDVVTFYLDEGGKGHQPGFLLTGIPNDTQFDVVIRNVYGHACLPVRGWLCSVDHEIGIVIIPPTAEKTRKHSPYELVLSGVVGKKRIIRHVLRIHLKSKRKGRGGTRTPMMPQTTALCCGPPLVADENVTLKEEEKRLILYGINDEMGYPAEFQEGDIAEMMVKWMED